MTSTAEEMRRDQGAAQLGLIVKMPAAATVELAGHAGFDFALIDTEHGSCDMTELEHHVRAADSAGIRTLVRVSEASSADVLRALDAGAHGIIVPHVRSADDVARAVAATHYPPQGRRSIAVSTRAGRHGMRTIDEHIEAARRDVLLIAQIEDADALERLPQIVGAEGLDAIFIGPSDLSVSLGRPGRLDDPLVADAIDRVAQAVVAQPGVALCVLAADEQEASAWIMRGARIVLLNAPSLLAARLRTIADELRAKLDLDTIRS